MDLVEQVGDIKKIIRSFFFFFFFTPVLTNGRSDDARLS